VCVAVAATACSNKYIVQRQVPWCGAHWKWFGHHCCPRTGGWPCIVVTIQHLGDVGRVVPLPCQLVVCGTLRSEMLCTHGKTLSFGTLFKKLNVWRWFRLLPPLPLPDCSCRLCLMVMQDFRLSEQVAKAGCACVVAVNKWDKVSEKAAEDMDAYKADVKAQLREVGWAPVVCTTARWVKHTHMASRVYCWIFQKPVVAMGRPLLVAPPGGIKACHTQSQLQ